MIRYIYKIEVKNTNLYYIGQRTTNCNSPELDSKYMGSGKALRDYPLNRLKKTILSVHETQEELDQAEKDAIGNKWTADKNCLNKKAGGSGAGARSMPLNLLPEIWESTTINGELFIKLPRGDMEQEKLLRKATVKTFIYQMYLNDGGQENNSVDLTGKTRLPQEIEGNYVYTKRGRGGFTAVKPALLKMLLLQLGAEVQVAFLTGAYEIKTIMAV